MNQHNLRILIRNFVIELILYGGLVVAYFLIVLRLLGQSLAQLFHSNLVAYGIVALILIVAQGVFLEMITSFLMERLPLERLE